MAGKGGKNLGSGRKAFVPTDEERANVQLWAGLRISELEIAVLVRDGIHFQTLRKYFEREISLGRALDSVETAKNIKEKSMLPNGSAAAIFWAETQMGWTKTDKVELSGSLDISKIKRVIVGPTRRNA